MGGPPELLNCILNSWLRKHFGGLVQGAVLRDMHVSFACALVTVSLKQDQHISYKWLPTQNEKLRIVSNEGCTCCCPNGSSIHI